ncbi:MAG: FAD-dependent oxidoreductase [Mucilaginibacter polytrichastri]|nr:FAD-dependent oxidoreductase [Mucilaginibacter polytrichastri]
MDLKAGLPWWLIKNGLLLEYNTLTEDLQTEVLIIGSGITGALAAHYLGKAGVKCVLVDKRMTGTGSTTASTAQLQYEIDTYLSDLIGMVGEEHAVESYRLCLKSITDLENVISEVGIECGFERRSSLYLASDKKGLRDLQREFETRKKYDLPVEFLDHAALKKRFKIDRPAALYNQESAQVDAYKLSQAILAHHIEHSGLKVYSHVQISKIKQAKEGVIFRTEEGLTIKARKVICAPGFESEFFLKEKVMDLNSTYVFVSRPVQQPLWNEQSLIWETARPYMYIRTTSDNRVILGGEDEKFTDPGRRNKLMEKKNQLLLKKFKKLFPTIELEVDFYWCGTFGETKDGLPYIGEHKKQPHFYFALGYGGNGITFSVIAAQIIRDMYLGKENKAARIFAFDR